MVQGPSPGLAILANSRCSLPIQPSRLNAIRTSGFTTCDKIVLMPGRKFPLVKNYFYHIYNRGVELRPIFTNKREYQGFTKLLDYYQFKDVPNNYSSFKRLKKKTRNNLLAELKKDGIAYVDIIAYCLMPNHFHLLLKQNTENGISNFLRKVQNSYTKYFNKKNERVGHLFQGRFKSVIVENEYQLLHLSRYIHLNPYSGAVVKNLKGLIHYSWSSLPEYITQIDGFCKKAIILNAFGNKQKYQEFVFDNADYQKELETIKHLTLEKKF